MQDQDQTVFSSAHDTMAGDENCRDAVAVMAAVEEMLESTIRHPQVEADDVLTLRLTTINRLAGLAVHLVERAAERIVPRQ